MLLPADVASLCRLTGLYSSGKIQLHPPQETRPPRARSLAAWGRPGGERNDGILIVTSSRRTLPSPPVDSSTFLRRQD